MYLDSYSYKLPENLIAQRPASPRDSCRLLILENGIKHETFENIIDYLKPGDVLVLNDTKVSHSKLVGKKESGSPAEIILLNKISEKIYEAKVKTRNPHPGTKIICRYGNVSIKRKINIDTFIVELDDNKILNDAILPTPPYIKRKLDDKEYQTEFSKKEGSLAAPTAGLHFTKRLLNKILKKGIIIVHITLHVSYGTFKNIDDIKTYIMEPEQYEISEDAASKINGRKGRLIVCGTTTLKALETSSSKGKIIPRSGASTLFIYPPYKFKSGTDILITNFHLSKSTLLLLTCEFGGRERIMEAYQEAVDMKYRFFSLGDAMMIYNKNF
ncbi:MAG: tRNA preQ1(34) S-adenosylmethionine ribosyltransferase-isomerase QueA [Candidatus Woesearchaeota archaeon]